MLEDLRSALEQKALWRKLHDACNAALEETNNKESIQEAHDVMMTLGYRIDIDLHRASRAFRDMAPPEILGIAILQERDERAKQGEPPQSEEFVQGSSKGKRKAED